MNDNYRMTIRVSEQTANTFRDLAYQESLTLGDMLNELIHGWQGKSHKQEFCSKLLAMKFSN